MYLSTHNWCLSGLCVFFLVRVPSLLSLWWGRHFHGDETDRGWLKWSLICWENWPQSELFYQEDTLPSSAFPSINPSSSLHPCLSSATLYSAWPAPSLCQRTSSLMPPLRALHPHFSSPSIHSHWSLSICHHCSVMVICPFGATHKFAVNKNVAATFHLPKSTLKFLWYWVV